MLNAFGYLSCFKLCWHNRPGPIQIAIVKRLVFVTCLFAVACVAGYFYYLWPASQHAVTSRVPHARNAIAGVLSVFISAQGNYTVNNPTPLGTTESMECC